MNRVLLKSMGLMIVVIAAFMIIIDAQEIANTVLNNTIPIGAISNGTLSNGPNNKTISNSTIPINAAEIVNSKNSLAINNSIVMNDSGSNSTHHEKAETISIGQNASLESNGSILELPNRTSYAIGNPIGYNKTAFELSSPAKQIKNASNMWYLIQGVPHGYT